MHKFQRKGAYFVAIVFMCLAIRKMCSSDSITFGPANKKNGSAVCQD